MSEESVQDNAAESSGTETETGGASGRGFTKGKSGNPGGQPQWVKKVRDSLRALTPLAKKTLRDVMQNGEDKARVAAAKTVLEYTVPKPKQRLKVSGQLSNPVGELSTEDIQALIRATKGEGK